MTRLLRENKQTYLLTLLCSPLCSLPGTGAHLGDGTGPVPPSKEDRGIRTLNFQN